MSTTCLVRRVDRIVATRHRRTIWDAMETIATRLGVTLQEVMDEAYRLHHEARRLGIAPVEDIARECGMSASDVRQDAAHPVQTQSRADR